MKFWVSSHNVSEDEQCEVGSVLEFVADKLNDVDCLKLCHIDLVQYLRMKHPEDGEWQNWFWEGDDDGFERLCQAFSRLHGADAEYDFRRIIGSLMKVSGLSRLTSIRDVLSQRHGNLHGWEEFSMSLELYHATTLQDEFGAHPVGEPNHWVPVEQPATRNIGVLQPQLRK